MGKHVHRQAELSHESDRLRQQLQRANALVTALKEQHEQVQEAHKWEIMSYQEEGNKLRHSIQSSEKRCCDLEAEIVGMNVHKSMKLQDGIEALSNTAERAAAKAMLAEAKVKDLEQALE